MSRLHVGPGIALKPRAWAKGLSPSKRIMLVSEPRAFLFHGRKVREALRRAGFEVSSHLFPEGENAKTWESVSRLLSAMLSAGMGRDAGLVAVGGGSVTDAAGFAAAIYLRGIPWASLPTTLLGQLDGGLGGKTAINLPEGKNLAGAFHQPVAVACDPLFLGSLPERELVSGLAEAIKVGLVFEPAFWGSVRSLWPRLVKGEPAALSQVVRRGAAWKLKIVGQDERETKGKRELLNFGHTLGHALERAAGLGRLRHGEAVIWGMRAAVALSAAVAGLPRSEAAAVESFLASLPVPLEGGLDAGQVLGAARLDKKARKGGLRFVLLKRLGKPVVRGGIPESLVLKTIESLLQYEAPPASSWRFQK